MTKVSHSSICPYCEINLLDYELETGYITPTALKDRCPSCNKIIKKPSNELFESPDYVHHQKTTLLKELSNSKRFDSNDDVSAKAFKIESEHDKWFRRCLHEDRVAAIRDAASTLEHLLYSNASREEISQLLKLSEKIEKLTTTIKSFIQIGGPLYEREIRRVRAYDGYTDGGEAAASASRD